MCKDQRTVCENWFSPSLGGSQRLTSGLAASAFIHRATSPALWVMLQLLLERVCLFLLNIFCFYQKLLYNWHTRKNLLYVDLDFTQNVQNKWPKWPSDPNGQGRSGDELSFSPSNEWATELDHDKKGAQMYTTEWNKAVWNVRILQNFNSYIWQK